MEGIWRKNACIFDPPTPLEFPIPSMVGISIFSGTTHFRLTFQEQIVTFRYLYFMLHAALLGKQLFHGETLATALLPKESQQFDRTNQQKDYPLIFYQSQEWAKRLDNYKFFRIMWFWTEIENWKLLRELFWDKRSGEYQVSSVYCHQHIICLLLACKKSLCLFHQIHEDHSWAIKDLLFGFRKNKILAG